MLTTESVSGPADPRLDPFRNIKGQSRRTDGTFVAESELVLERLFASRIAVRSILLTPARAERLTPSLTRFCVAANGEQAIAVFVAEQSVIDTVVGYPLHRGVIAVADRPAERSVSDVLTAARTVVVLEEVMDPDNVGSVFRHAAGFGVDAVLLSGPTGDPLYRKTIRTSMGWTLQIPYARIGVGAAVPQLLSHAGFVTLALTPSRSADLLSTVLRTHSSSDKIAFLVGSEGPGLKASTLADADHRVRIPLADGVDSLNVATAAAVALYALVDAQTDRP